MAKNINVGLSISTILSFVGGITILIATFFPLVKSEDSSKTNKIFSSCQLAISLSNYLSPEISRDEKKKALDNAQESLDSRMSYVDSAKFKSIGEKIEGHNVSAFLKAALEDISILHGYVFVNMEETKPILKYIAMINKTSANPSMINLLDLNTFVSNHKGNFTAKTVTKARFHRLIIGCIILLGLLAIGLFFLFGFRQLNVVFLAFSLLGAILSVVLFLIITYSTDDATVKGISLIVAGDITSKGTYILVLGAMLFIFSAFAGINSSNWLMAIVVYLIVMMIIVIVYLFFRSSFITQTEVAFLL